jgi:hypothetical protein
MAGIAIEAQEGNFQGFGLVRNAEGKPQFSDWNDIPEPFHQLLTEEDWEYIKLKQQEAE